MPFIPHTQVDIDEMLAEIGIDQLDALFDEIPAGLISDRLDHVPDGMGEMAMLQIWPSVRNKIRDIPVSWAGVATTIIFRLRSGISLRVNS